MKKKQGKTVFDLEVGDVTRHSFLVLDILDFDSCRKIFWMISDGQLLHSFYAKSHHWDSCKLDIL